MKQEYEIFTENEDKLYPERKGLTIIQKLEELNSNGYRIISVSKYGIDTKYSIIQSFIIIYESI